MTSNKNYNSIAIDDDRKSAVAFTSNSNSRLERLSSSTCPSSGGNHVVEQRKNNKKCAFVIFVVATIAALGLVLLVSKDTTLRQSQSQFSLVRKDGNNNEDDVVVVVDQPDLKKLMNEYMNAYTNAYTNAYEKFEEQQESFMKSKEEEILIEYGPYMKQLLDNVVDEMASIDGVEMIDNKSDSAGGVVNCDNLDFVLLSSSDLSTKGCFGFSSSTDSGILRLEILKDGQSIYDVNMAIDKDVNEQFGPYQIGDEVEIDFTIQVQISKEPKVMKLCGKYDQNLVLEFCSPLIPIPDLS